MARKTHGDWTRHAFSLVELLVVLLIFGILMAIAVPNLVATQPERNLAAAGDMFANDFNYCRAKAEATGNRIYLGFMTKPDVRQLEGVWDSAATEPGAPADSPTLSGNAFINPANPGVSRVATGYYIVEERPRYNSDGSPITYLDWLDAFDRWQYDSDAYPYPVEPMFPFNLEDTYAYGVMPDPTLGPTNAILAPLVASSMDMRSGNENTTYEQRFRILPGELNGTDGWADGHVDDQQYKVFCVADEAEILAYDQNPDGAGYTLGNEVPRSYDPVAGGTYGGYSGSFGDHPRLRDQVVDYVMLKRVELPEHCYFLNPWKNTWVVGWEDPDANNDPDYYEYQDMQFLQYLWEFKPEGEISLAGWGYDPEPYPNGSMANQIHGTIVDRDGPPTVRMMWMVLEECLNFNASTTEPSRVALMDNRKSQQSSSGRMFCFWPLNGKYYVSDYTPNDAARAIAYDDARLNLTYGPGGNTATEEMDVMPLVAREYGYSQNFLDTGY